MKNNSKMSRNKYYYTIWKSLLTCFKREYTSDFCFGICSKCENYEYIFECECK